MASERDIKDGNWIIGDMSDQGPENEVAGLSGCC